MKFFKLSFLIAVAFLFAASSCKKDKEDNTVTKEQLLGKYDMVLQSGSTLQTMTANLKGSGSMGLDLTNPADGTDDMIFLWDTKNNRFNAYIDMDTIANAMEFTGTVDPITLGISGTFKLNDPQSPQLGIFTMDKKQ